MRYFILSKRAFVGACVLAALILCVLLQGAAQVVRVAAVAARQHPIYSVETERMEVSLGINCAWDNGDIPTLLAVLERYHVKATFFVVGDWCDKYPESVKAIYDAGHEIGSHSDTHADMTRLSREGILREIRDSGDKIEAITGQRPLLFRPPSGAYNDTVVELIRQEGLYPIQWDCDSIDYRDPTADEMQARIMKKLRRGSILLFHSGAKNTPAALPQILDAVTEKGYRFVPVCQLIHQGDYTVDFEGRQHPAETPLPGAADAV